MSLTNETLLAAMVLDYKEKCESNLFAINYELKELKTDFCKLDSDQAISGNVNDKLKKQLITL